MVVVDREVSMYEPRASIGLDGGDCNCQTTTFSVTRAGHRCSRHLSLLNNAGSQAEVPIASGTCTLAQPSVVSPEGCFAGAYVGVNWRRHRPNGVPT